MKIFATCNIKGATSFLFRIKPRVKGGGKALIRGAKALDNAIKGTDFDDLDLLPADFTYRHLDLVLGSAGQDEAAANSTGQKPTRKIARLLRPLDRRKKLHQQIIQDLQAERPGVAATPIPALSMIERMSVERAPVTAFAPRSMAARAYRGLWSELH